jgi:hypothetical protein
MDAVYRLDISFPHQGSSLFLEFLAMDLQDLLNESWGIDNISVRIQSDYQVFIPIVQR